VYQREEKKELELELCVCVCVCNPIQEVGVGGWAKKRTQNARGKKQGSQSKRRSDKRQNGKRQTTNDRRDDDVGRHFAAGASEMASLGDWNGMPKEA